MSFSLIYYRGGNSQFLQVSGFKDQTTNPATYLNDATMSATLYDASGQEVPGAASMAGVYQAASNGVYRFAVDPTVFNPTDGSGYLLKVTGTSVSGAKYETEIAVKIKTRKSGTETY